MSQPFVCLGNKYGSTQEVRNTFRQFFCMFQSSSVFGSDGVIWLLVELCLVNFGVMQLRLVWLLIWFGLAEFDLVKSRLVWFGKVWFILVEIQSVLYVQIQDGTNKKIQQKFNKQDGLQSCCTTKNQPNYLPTNLWMDMTY